MNKQFDPYHVWLGIATKEQPPNHYRLLGIDAFEDDREVIENAADQKVIHLRTFQLSKHRESAEKLLNQVATAKICLLNPAKKAAYDQQLHKLLDAPAPVPAPALPAPLPASTKSPGPAWLLPAIGAVAVLSVLGGVLGWLLSGGNRPGDSAGQVASATPERVAQEPSRPEPAKAQRAPVASPPPPKTRRSGAPSPTNAAFSENVRHGLPDLRATPGKAADSGVPPPATAPFDAQQAKQHQQRWAEHLGVPVEETNSIGTKLVLIPPGEFDMGSTDDEIAWANTRNKDSRYYLDDVPFEAPRHRVKITRPFRLGTYPVTQGEYEKVLGVNPSAFTEKHIDLSLYKPPLSESGIKNREADGKKAAGIDTRRHPVETVNWDDAIEFCSKLSAVPAERAAGRVYRLPTEAEWEYACRAGTTTRWYCGDDEAGLAQCAWFNKKSGGMTGSVGEKRPNAWGLYDMHGNVNQWCADWFGADYYKSSPLSDPTGPLVGSRRLLRGGDWGASAAACRSAFRFPNPGRTHRNHFVGFRVVAEVAAVESENVRHGLPDLRATPGKAAGDSNARPPATAPFDVQQAKQHQQRWAEQLGVPVEETNSIGTKLVLIPPGEFDMGSTDDEIAWALAEGKKNKSSDYYFDDVRFEAPRHRVTITRPFRLGMYPVTQGEYEKVMRINPSGYSARQRDGATFQRPLSESEIKFRVRDREKVSGMDTSRHPVETVSWEEAIEFCRRLSALPAEQAARRVYRLPTEAEWEYACRAGTTTRWWCGEDEAALAGCDWFSKNAVGMTHPVGEKKPNPWGLFDMHGNVSQWCADWFDADYYKNSPPSDPAGPAAGARRLLRGGNWHSGATSCRSAFRYPNTNGKLRSHYAGFRVAVAR
jgi:formylglycine-generating enzyme required for sulfatase activity